ncbi:MAG: hypothetical protein KJ971_04335 [Firmicutes bacterium]|nr:hypothetical protein [Bacillota bacterium]
MKSLLTKKVVIVFSVLIVIVLSAILLAFLTGSTNYPEISDPDGIFYQTTDDDGNVLYTITNKELFEEIKTNDGIEQLLFMVDAYLLEDYLNALTTEQIEAKLLELEYGTSDLDEINALEADLKLQYETAYQQSITLAGYLNNEEAYAKIILAREEFVRHIIDVNEEITDLAVAKEYANYYFEDIDALKIRFTSSEDAAFVMNKVNLVVYNLTSLREYSGFIYQTESILDPLEGVVEAYKTVTPYFFDQDENILNLDEEIIYTLGTNSIYTDSSDDEYAIDETGNLVDIADEIVIENDLLFDSVETAQAYKDANTIYYTVSKVDAFDENEDAVVTDGADVVQYTIDSDGKIYDLLSVDVTSTTDLIVNKIYTPIEDVNSFTLNNSIELTNAEILLKYIAMYNYVYEVQRDSLPTDATADELIALNNDFLIHNFDEVSAYQASLATYMFSTLDLNDEDLKPFTVTPKKYAASSDNGYYMVYKLSQVDKVDVLEIMLDYIENNIILPSQTVDNLELPVTGWYSSTITWSSGDTAIISNAGVVTLPDADTEVELTYTITANSITRTGIITVNVLTEGTTSEVTQNTSDEVTFKSLLNDDALYLSLYNGLIEDMVTGSSSDTNISSRLVTLRADYGFVIYDRYLGLDYQETDATYELNEKGNKVLLATLTGRPGSEEAAFEISADDFFSYTLTKNAALYTLFASEYKELVASDYFTEVFGSVTNIEKNKSARMLEMYDSVQSAKDYYSYLQSLYASYGLAFTYNSFADYAYSQYGTKTEYQLLEYFVEGELQPYLINEAISDYDLITLLYPTVESYYQNYFSLNVSHIVIYLDFNEDGTPDDFMEYIDNLTALEADEFETLRAGLEYEIDQYLDDDTNSFTTLVSDFQNASREDETWGDFKQYGFLILTEDLNTVDDDDVSHSLQYSGTYGIKDTYVTEYVDALIALYQAYQSDINQDVTELYSNDENISIETIFGIHIILVTQGDDFDHPTAAFSETDSQNPIYSVGSENTEAIPSMEQLQLYADYFFYSTVYNLTDADVESTYGITIPKIPASVNSTLEFYFGDLLSSFYVVGTVNVIVADKMVDGSFVSTDYLNLTNAELQASLLAIRTVYYDALYGQYAD